MRKKIREELCRNRLGDRIGGILVGMEPIDPEFRHQQIAEAYSRMPDEQLQAIAADYADLTETACAALRAEMERRGLQMPSADSPPTVDDVEEGELITIRLFRDLPEALLAKGLLESSGIECFLADDNMVRLDWFISNAIGNMKLQVNQADAAAAMEILNQPASDVASDIAEDEQ
jgi:hypothetical protein